MNRDSEAQHSLWRAVMKEQHSVWRAAMEARRSLWHAVMKAQNFLWHAVRASAHRLVPFVVIFGNERGTIPAPSLTAMIRSMGTLVNRST